MIDYEKPDPTRYPNVQTRPDPNPEKAEPFATLESNTIFQKPQKGVCLSVLSFVTFSRPQFQSYEVETLHAASSHEGDERRS